MKTKLIILCFFFSCLMFSQNLKKGQTINNLEFKGLLNSDKETLNLKELKGKIVILEFWATWCGPCIPAMDHLIKLKETYGDRLEVIGITYDNRQRIEKYINNKPSNVKFISDLDNSYKKLFPHNAIPHTIIIDKDCKFLAETKPVELTEEVMKNLFTLNKFIGEEKVETSRNGFSYTTDYFPPRPNEKERFMLQPIIENGVPMVKRFNKGEFKDRRVTFINSSIFNILKYVYDLNADNTYRLNDIDMDYLKSTNYCLDVFVAAGTDLKKYMRSKINEAFPNISLNLKKEIIEVLELKQIPDQRIKLIKTTASNKTPNSSITRVSNYNKSDVTLDNFTEDYLNKFIAPIFKKTIINSTNLDGKFNINFEFEVEDPQSFKRELGKLGLKLEPTKQETEILTIGKENN